MPYPNNSAINNLYIKNLNGFTNQQFISNL